MAKITLTNLVNLQNETTAVNAINTNNAAITTALNNTLSRDGTSPNTMSALLDMNSNRIINLPVATSGDEPVRKHEFDLITNGYTGNNIIVGTNNEINVSSSLGTTTISLPTGITATGKTITGGTFAGPTVSGTPNATTSKFIADGARIINAVDYGVSTANSDNGPAINALIITAAVNGDTIRFSAGTYNYSTPINFTTAFGVTLEGPTGAATGGVSRSAVLQYTGTGTANAVVVSACQAIKFKNLAFITSSSSYTGQLITVGAASALTTFENCLLTGRGTCHGINLDASLENLIDRCSFGSFNIAIDGKSTAGSYCNNVTIRNTQFTNGVTTYIRNVGSYWTFLDTVFEAGANGAAMGILGFAANPSYNLLMANCWFGDVTANGGEFIDMSGRSLTFIGNFFGSLGGTNNNGLVLDSSTNIVIKGNEFSGLNAGLVFNGTCVDVDIEPNYFASNVADITGLANITGYGSFHRLANGMIMEYGSATVTTGTPLVITMPKAMTAAPTSIQVTGATPTAATNDYYVTTVTSTQFSINVSGTAGTQTVYWTAIGKVH